MKKASILFLRFVLAMMALLMLGVCCITSWVVLFDNGFGAEHRYLDVLLLAVVYTMAVPYWFTLLQSAKLLRFVDRGLAFSEPTVKALTVIIKSTLALFAISTIGGLPFFYQIADLDDAPGVMVIGLMVAGVALTSTVFSYVFRSLVQEAIGLKNRGAL